MYVVINPQTHNAPDEEKRRILGRVYAFARGNRRDALRYLEHCKKALDPDAVQIGVRTFEYLVSSC